MTRMDHRVHPAHGVGAGFGQGRGNAYRRPLAELVFSPWVLLPVALILGAFIGLQFFSLTPRYVKLLFGVAFFAAVVRLPFSRAMILFLIMWPAPTFIFLADTNVLFLGVMLVVWATRMVIGTEARPVRSPLSWCLGVYLLAHVLSFLNITDPFHFAGATQNMVFMSAGVVFFILLLNALRTEKDVELALKALSVTAVIVYATALSEYHFRFRLIPEWFIFAPALVDSMFLSGRLGGLFGSHGLLADFSASCFYMHLLLGMRSRRLAAKLLHYSLCFLALYTVAITANRGGAIIWCLGGIYYLWLYRRRIRWGRAALLLSAAAGAILALGVTFEGLMRRATIFTRLAQTQLERGVPENRVIVWNLMINKITDHIWIGHGPFVDLRPGFSEAIRWPHNAFLFYLYSTGVIGLFSYLWILGKTLWMSLPRGTVDFARGPFCRAAQALLHIQVIMFAASQLRTDHQRGNVYIYFMWLLFALAMVTTRLVKDRNAQSALTLRR